MRIKLVALLAGAFGLAATTMASAADMAVKAPAPYAIPYSWTGLYAGVHAGAGWGTVESNVDLGGFTLPISSHEINGPLAGLQIGYNYQMGWALIGLEATGSWSDIKGTAPCLFGIATEEEVATLRSTVQTLEDTVATLEARAKANRPTP